MSAPASQISSNQIASETAIRSYDVVVYLDNGEMIFKLMLDDHPVGENIYVDPEIHPQLNLIFNLIPSTCAAGAMWGDEFVWPDGMPSYISFQRASNMQTSIFNDAISAPGAETKFMFKVVLDGKTYISPDPVIINKKPPTEDET